MESFYAVVVHVRAAHRCGLRGDRAEDQQQAEMPHCGAAHSCLVREAPKCGSPEQRSPRVPTVERYELRTCTTGCQTPKKPKSWALASVLLDASTLCSTTSKKARSAAVIAAKSRGRADRTHVDAVLKQSDAFASTSKSLHAVHSAAAGDTAAERRRRDVDATGPPVNHGPLAAQQPPTKNGHGGHFRRRS